MEILILSSDQEIVDFFRSGLCSAQHSVTVAQDMPNAIAMAVCGDFDVFILTSSTRNDPEAARRLIEEVGGVIPILSLPPANSIKSAGRAAFTASRPPSKDFESVVSSLVCAARPGDGNRLVAGDLLLDRDTREVQRAGHALVLTAKELAILELLMASPGRTWSRERIYRLVWATEQDPVTNIVDVYVRRLRRALTSAGEPDPIETLRGHGYRLRVPSS